MALELEDHVSPGKRARQTECDLTGFAAAGGKRRQLGTGHQFLDLFGYQEFQLVLRAVVGGKLRLPAHCLQDRRMTIPQNHRTPGEHIIDVLVAVHILQAGAAAVTEVQRDGSFRAKRTGDAARERSLRALQVFPGLRPVVDHVPSSRRPEAYYREPVHL